MIQKQGKKSQKTEHHPSGETKKGKSVTKINANLRKKRKLLQI